MKKWIALACTWLALALAGCGSAPSSPGNAGVWNGGVWNSMLGYHGPSNVVVAGAP